MASFIVLDLQARGDRHGAIAFTVFAATVVLTRLLAGDLPDRIGPLRCAAGAAAVEALGLSLIALATGLPMAIVGAAAMGDRLLAALPVALARGGEPGGRGSARVRRSAPSPASSTSGSGLGAPIAGVAAAARRLLGRLLARRRVRARDPERGAWRSEEPGCRSGGGLTARVRGGRLRALAEPPVGPPATAASHHGRQPIGFGAAACMRPAA